MLDLVAITVGLLAFCGWSGLMMFGGYAARKQAERREQARRINQMIEDAKRQRVPNNVEPSAAVRRRAQA